MPYARELSINGHPVVIDSGDYAGLLTAALDAFDWDAVQQQLQARRVAGEAVGAGIGVF